LLLLRAPQEGTQTQGRSHHALSPSQTSRVLEVWPTHRLLHLRNRALIAVLFLVGLRRSEAVTLRWEDINLEEGFLYVRHGKGEAPRHATIAGDAAIQALHDWQRAIDSSRMYIFCSIGKGDRLGPDTPLSDQAVYYVVKQTQKLGNVVFSPHDARRTFITEALITGTPLADVRDQVGHKQESTTLRYAQSIHARQRRTRLRLRYGSD
jgi:integrase/recombinase XerD